MVIFELIQANKNVHYGTKEKIEKDVFRGILNLGGEKFDGEGSNKFAKAFLRKS